MRDGKLGQADCVEADVDRPAADISPPPSPPWMRPSVAWYGIGMVAAVTVFGQLDRGIMSLLVVSIKRDTLMTDTQISLLMGLAYSLVYMGVGLPMARVTDVGRRTRILPAALTVWSLGTALCGIAQNFWQFFIFRGLVGGGEAVKGPTSASLIPDLVPPEKLPRAFGIYNVAIMGGEALALIIGGFLLGFFEKHPIHLPGLGATHSWQSVYLAFGVPGVALALLFVLTVPEPARHGRRHKTGSAPVREVVAFFVRGTSGKVFVPLLTAAVITGIYSMGLLSWRPTFYERTYGLTPDQYGPIVGLASLVTAPVGAILGAWIAERLSKKWDDAYLRVAVISQICAMPVAIASPLMPTFWLALGGQLLYSTTLMIGAPSQLAAMQVVTPNEMRAQINAVYMFTVGVIGSGFGPVIIALVTDYLFHDESQLRYAMVASTAIAMPIALFCTWRAMRAYGPLFRETVKGGSS